MRRADIEIAISHLQKSDAKLGDVISRVGPFTLRPNSDRFAMLARSIVSQQVSTKAARAIWQRLEDLIAPDVVSAENLTRQTVEDLRAVGLSGQKVKYLLDLSAHVLDDRLKLKTIGRRKDAEIIEQLTAVKGIGEWTAHMFLIFSLGRMDILPHGDYGLRSALRILHNLEELPDKAASHRLAEPWRPYASVGTWYCWRMLELPATE